MQPEDAGREGSEHHPKGGLGKLLKSWFKSEDPANITHEPHHKHYRTGKETLKAEHLEGKSNLGEAPHQPRSSPFGLLRTWVKGREAPANVHPHVAPAQTAAAVAQSPAAPAGEGGESSTRAS